eukprot:gnl/Dysnectes_brevis/6439_a9993_340.p1 GENE.gnl/Dysnectes_brevis/6439_a9993_340~~gnl/Dysnectes_brevis/6439_a9993_340.p1  ORF type:complete len:503 (+),score=140.72 gnl/Dysnectes_brevis/6439_a9993_340:234-1742(+)
MLFAQQIFSKNSPLGRVWNAGNLKERVAKRIVQQINVEELGKLIQEQPLAFRYQGVLLIGLTVVQDKKARFLLTQANNALYKVRINPKGTRGKAIQAKRGAITLPRSVDTLATLDLTLEELAANSGLLSGRVADRARATPGLSSTGTASMSGLDLSGVFETFDTVGSGSISLATGQLDLDIDLNGALDLAIGASTPTLTMGMGELDLGDIPDLGDGLDMDEFGMSQTPAIELDNQLLLTVEDLTLDSIAGEATSSSGASKKAPKSKAKARRSGHRAPTSMPGYDRVPQFTSSQVRRMLTRVPLECSCVRPLLYPREDMCVDKLLGDNLLPLMEGVELDLGGRGEGSYADGMDMDMDFSVPEAPRGEAADSPAVDRAPASGSFGPMDSPDLPEASLHDTGMPEHLRHALSGGSSVFGSVGTSEMSEGSRGLEPEGQGATEGVDAHIRQLLLDSGGVVSLREVLGGANRHTAVRTLTSLLELYTRDRLTLSQSAPLEEVLINAM